MDNKTDVPDSDETARRVHAISGDDDLNPADAIDGVQTSNKTGKHSSVEKLAASRPEFGAGRGAQPVSGASDNVNTNQYQCHSCGRYFTTREELSEHETDCRLAKSATASGRANLS